MSKLQATIPEPYTNVQSLYSSVLALKELVEVLAGQRGDKYRVAYFSELPAAVAGDQLWSPLPYINAWTDYGSPYSPCGFRKLSSGLVLTRGLVMNGNAATICVLPAGYRPGIQLLFAAETSPNALCRIDVSTAGGISHTGGNTGWISLNGLCWLAEN